MSDLIHELGFYAAKRKWPKGLEGMPDILKRAAAALSEAEQRVPEGWQLVPKQPTPAMAFTGINAVVRGQKYDTPSDPLFAADLAACNGDKGAVRSMQNYRAMLAASPALIPSEPHDAEGRE